MTALSAADYRHSRLTFIGALCLMWFFLLWGLGYMVASKLPGDGPVAWPIACLFFPVGFFPVLFFGAPGMLIGFLQKYLAGDFQLPRLTSTVSPPKLWRAGDHNNPWLLGLNRLLFFWAPATLLAILLLWFLFPNGISRSLLGLALGLLSALLVGVTAMTSTGRPFFHELQVSQQQRLWQGSLLSYLLWRHGIPWGLGNGLLNAVLAVPLFPAAPGGPADIAPTLMVSVDTFFTSLILCFFMAISAHPHALVDGQLGVIRPPGNARSPTRGKRIALFVLGSFALALVTGLVLMAAGIDSLSIGEFILWKAIAATGIASVAAMLVAYWTLAQAHLPDAPAKTGPPS